VVEQELFVYFLVHHILFIIVVGLKTVSVLFQAKMDITFHAIDMGEMIACTVFASLPGFPCWKIIDAILSHIRGHTRAA